MMGKELGLPAGSPFFFLVRLYVGYSSMNSLTAQ